MCGQFTHTSSLHRQGENQVSRVRQKGSRVVPFPSSNVIDFSNIRTRRMRNGPLQPLFYINGSGSCLDLLHSFRHLQTVDIYSPQLLEASVLMRRPALILLEASIDWTDPIATIKSLNRLSDVPVVLLCDAQTKRRCPSLIKRAYAAGIFDVLFTPLSYEDLFETLEVLLKFRLKAAEES